jgi:hypothetical protein
MCAAPTFRARYSGHPIHRPDESFRHIIKPRRKMMFAIEPLQAWHLHSLHDMTERRTHEK